MQAEDRVDLGIIHDPFVDHNLGAATALFGRLEEDFHRPGELVAAVHQQPGDGQEHRGVGVVPTGVHHTLIHRLVVDLILLVDGQRIHVGADKNNVAGSLTAPNKAGYAGGCDSSPDILDAELAKAVHYERSGFEFLKSEFRMLVQVTPVGDHARHDLVNVVAQAGAGRGHTAALPCVMTRAVREGRITNRPYASAK